MICFSAASVPDAAYQNRGCFTLIGLLQTSSIVCDGVHKLVIAGDLGKLRD